MANQFRPLLYLKVTEEGVVDSRIASGTPGQAEAGSLLLSKLCYEIFLLNAAAKKAWAEVEEQNNTQGADTLEARSDE